MTVLCDRCGDRPATERYPNSIGTGQYCKPCRDEIVRQERDAGIAEPRFAPQSAYKALL